MQKKSGQINGCCVGGLNPVNDNDLRLMCDPLDINKSAGNTCSFNTDCGPDSKCLKESGYIKGVCASLPQVNQRCCFAKLRLKSALKGHKLSGLLQSYLSDSAMNRERILMLVSRAIFFVLIVGLISCSTLSDKTLLISPGDSKEEVIRTLGTPQDRQFREHQEAWQYGTIVAMGICEYTIIWLSNDVVTGLNTYKNKSVAGCRVGIETVNWEQAPDTIIEIR